MDRMLVIAEAQDGGAPISEATQKTLAAARKIGSGGLDLLFVGAGLDSLSEKAGSLAGVERVFVFDDPRLAHPTATMVAGLVSETARSYGHVLMPGTSFGRDVLPRLAGLLKVPMVSDVLEVLEARVFKRGIYAGNVHTVVRVPDGIPVLLTVRLASWRVPEERSNNAIPVERRPVPAHLDESARFLELAVDSTVRPDLQSARRVVSGGRALGSRENFALLEKLADRLNAAVGASRAAVDAGYASNDLQVGQTGKIIAPELYMAFGISGAIQHVTGIRDARTIVAVNKDPEAPIFKIADFGLVGDLFEVIPELLKAIGQGTLQ
ncbi:MAG: electron transfer flavoprotein subunit alpha/FixB family protein [Gammaproteobacteria bacterium]